MKKQTKALAEIGVMYVVASILLDYLLGGYQILLWPALAFECALFGIMILNVFWERLPPPTEKHGRNTSENEDELTRLKRLCEAAITRRDRAAEKVLTERIRSLAFAAAANSLSTTETALRNIAEERRDLLEAKITDPQLFDALTNKGSLVRSDDPRTLVRLLEKIEGWTT
jgi:hypothetical protein